MECVSILDYGGKYGVIRRIITTCDKNTRIRIIQYIESTIGKYSDINYVEFVEHEIHVWGSNNYIVDKLTDNISNKLVLISFNNILRNYKV